MFLCARVIVGAPEDTCLHNDTRVNVFFYCDERLQSLACIVYCEFNYDKLLIHAMPLRNC